MRENISELAKNAVIDFRKLNDSKKLYTMGIILNHIENGLINDGNYSSGDEAYENDNLVFEAKFVNLDDPMKLATNLLVIGATKEGITINPNGIDIEPYIKDKSSMDSIMSTFYKLNYCDKIDFITEILYDISIIEEVKSLDFDFNDLIDEFLTYRKETFGGNLESSLEVEKE